MFKTIIFGLNKITIDKNNKSDIFSAVNSAGRQQNFVFSFEEGDIVSLLNNKYIHSLKEPAILCKDGSKYWAQGGFLHRERGPAVQLANKTKMYYWHGLLHKEDGPAFIQGKIQKYYLFGNQFKDKISFEQELEKETKCFVVESKIECHYGYVLEKGDKYWKRGNQYHRLDGPAIEGKSGIQIFLVNDCYHNNYGPAIINPTRNIEAWYINNKKHRIGGASFKSKTEEYWHINGKLHREDGPAWRSRGNCYWYLNGKLHREDGPAIIDADGSMFFYLDGIQCTGPSDLKNKLEIRKNLLKKIIK